MSAAKSIHVLTLTPFYPSEQDDAAGCFVAEPLNALAQAGVSNTIFALQPFYRKRLHASKTNVTAAWLRYFSLPGNRGLPLAGAFVFARIVSRVRAMQKAGQVDLIHAHGPLPCGHAALLLARELGIPYVVSVHGLDAYGTEQVSGRAGEWCRRASRRVYQSSRRVICVSERVREEVLKGVGQSQPCRTSVVYNGVDAELFSPTRAPKPGSPNILSVGNLIPIKGHQTLIRAIGMIALEFPHVDLQIIGDGPERRHLEDLARQMNIADRVHFRGRQSRREVADAMQRCTVFALPSRYEGLGCVYLEAMATEKPVIGCRGQGIAEIIRQGSNGFLVGPDNEKELAIILGILLRDEFQRLNVGRAARDTVLDRFTLAQQAETLARIYRECVS